MRVFIRSASGVARRLLLGSAVLAAACTDDSSDPLAPTGNNQTPFPTHDELQAALREVLAENTGGLGFQMWASIVDRQGRVVDVVFSGERNTDEWPGSRVISAQKANTANAFTIPDFALSTANLYTAVQPGGSLFGLQESNPVDPEVAYAGNSRDYGTVRDRMIGEKIGGINVFGGGLALYASDGTLLGGIGVSGDRSCTDHNVAWKLRDAIGLDFVPNGAAGGTDNIIYDITVDDAGNDVSESGFGHPECSDAETEIGEDLPNSHPIGGQ